MSSSASRSSLGAVRPQAMSSSAGSFPLGKGAEWEARRSAALSLLKTVLSSASGGPDSAQEAALRPAPNQDPHSASAPPHGLPSAHGAAGPDPERFLPASGSEVTADSPIGHARVPAHGLPPVPRGPDSAHEGGGPDPALSPVAASSPVGHAQGKQSSAGGVASAHLPMELLRLGSGADEVLGSYGPSGFSEFAAQAGDGSAAEASAGAHAFWTVEGVLMIPEGLADLGDIEDGLLRFDSGLASFRLLSPGARTPARMASPAGLMRGYATPLRLASLDLGIESPDQILWRGDPSRGNYLSRQSLVPFPNHFPGASEGPDGVGMTEEPASLCPDQALRGGDDTSAMDWMRQHCGSPTGQVLQGGMGARGMGPPAGNKGQAKRKPEEPADALPPRAATAPGGEHSARSAGVGPGAPAGSPSVHRTGHVVASDPDLALSALPAHLPGASCGTELQELSLAPKPCLHMPWAAPAGNVQGGPQRSALSPALPGRLNASLSRTGQSQHSGPVTGGSQAGATSAPALPATHHPQATSLTAQAGGVRPGEAASVHLNDVSMRGERGTVGPIGGPAAQDLSLDDPDRGPQHKKFRGNLHSPTAVFAFPNNASASPPDARESTIVLELEGPRPPHCSLLTTSAHDQQHEQAHGPVLPMTHSRQAEHAWEKKGPGALSLAWPPLDKALEGSGAARQGPSVGSGQAASPSSQPSLPFPLQSSDRKGGQEDKGVAGEPGRALPPPPPPLSASSTATRSSPSRVLYALETVDWSDMESSVEQTSGTPPAHHTPRQTQSAGRRAGLSQTDVSLAKADVSVSRSQSRGSTWGSSSSEGAGRGSAGMQELFRNDSLLSLLSLGPWDGTPLEHHWVQQGTDADAADNANFESLRLNPSLPPDDAAMDYPQLPAGTAADMDYPLPLPAGSAAAALGTVPFAGLGLSGPGIAEGPSVTGAGRLFFNEWTAKEPLFCTDSEPATALTRAGEEAQKRPQGRGASQGREGVQGAGCWAVGGEGALLQGKGQPLTSPHASLQHLHLLHRPLLALREEPLDAQGDVAQLTQLQLAASPGKGGAGAGLSARAEKAEAAQSEPMGSAGNNVGGSGSSSLSAPSRPFTAMASALLPPERGHNALLLPRSSAVNPSSSCDLLVDGGLLGGVAADVSFLEASPAAQPGTTSQATVPGWLRQAVMRVLQKAEDSLKEAVVQHRLAAAQGPLDTLDAAMFALPHAAVPVVLPKLKEAERRIRDTGSLAPGQMPLAPDLPDPSASSAEPSLAELAFRQRVATLIQSLPRQQTPGSSANDLQARPCAAQRALACISPLQLPGSMDPAEASHEAAPLAKSHAGPASAAKPSPASKRRQLGLSGARGCLPRSAALVMLQWLLDHWDTPKPSRVEKDKLKGQCGISKKQVEDWFVNARARIWRPLTAKLSSELQAEGDD